MKTRKRKKTPRTSPNPKGMRKMEEYREFIRFTALPRILRATEFGYEEDKDFAKAHKINTCTPPEWKKKKEFWDEVSKTLKLWGKNRTPDVILGLHKKATLEGSAPEAKLWLQYIEDWREKIDAQDTEARKTLKDIQDNIRTIVERNRTKK
jgi:hypothetical protein